MTILKPGKVTIYADAQDGSGVRGQKTVKIYCDYSAGCTYGLEGYSTDYAVYPNPANDVINISAATLTELR